MSLVRGVLAANGVRTQSALNEMSSEDQRNTLIVELSNQCNLLVPQVQALRDDELAAAGAVMFFLHEARIRQKDQLKLMSLEDQRNTLIAELHGQTRRPTEDLQGLHNLDLVRIGLGEDNHFLRGVLIAGLFRTQAELNSMSAEDHRNTLIVEMQKHSNQPVSCYQCLDNVALAGAGAAMNYIRKTYIRTDDDLRGMSMEDQRNTLIVALSAQTGRPIPEIQGYATFDLVLLAIGIDIRTLAAANIRKLYLKSGAHRGPLGFPLSDVRYLAQSAEQRFAGGKIIFQDLIPKGIAETIVRVRFLGFHCVQESDSDGLSGSDEPYFIIGVAGSNGSNTIRFGPYENIDTGSNRFEAAMLSDPLTGQRITPPIVLAVAAYEHDDGTPQEAEDKVRAIIQDIERKFDQAAASFAGTSAGSHVLPEWARDIVIGWVPEAAAALFGLGDDDIGRVPKVMFDFNPGDEAWQTPPQLGLHGENPYNTVIDIDGGSEGKYQIFFNVEVVEMRILIE